jgi:DNA-binding transcriptional MocR family regulator
MSETNFFAYERVELAIESMIRNGTLRPGDRVPSIREICRREGASKSTVIQALSNLEAKSLILARPRSGFFVQALTLLPLPKLPEVYSHPHEPRLSDDVARVFRDLQKPSVIALGAGTPDVSLLPTSELARCVARAARMHASKFGGYSMCDTDLSLRREIALRLARSGGAISPDEIVITNGCMDALNLSLRALAKPGDTVLIETPTYFGLVQMIASLGMKILSVPATCAEGLDVSAFEKALKKHSVAACILIPSFGNPHGANLSQICRQAVVNIASIHNVPIIENDIYGELGFEQSQPRPLKSLPDAKDIILCGSLSKTLSPALRVGWVVAGEHAENVRRLKWISSITTPHVTSLAAADYLRSGGFDRHLRSLRKTLEIQMCRISNAIAKSFPTGTALSRPSGGYFLWAELPLGIDSLTLRDAAIERNISICPGPIFSVEGEFRNFIRINCALALDEKVLRAIETVGQIAHTLNATNENLAQGINRRNMPLAL